MSGLANLLYSAIGSLDGYVADAEGKFDWAAPNEEVHGFVNDLERRVGTYLYGRRMYETMVYWETAQDLPDPGGDFAKLWRAAEKIVYSRTLPDVTSRRTRLEREFDPLAIRRMKEAAERDLSVGGSELAAQAIRAGLVDEYHYFVNPVVVGAGTPWLPAGFHLDLELLDEHRFGGGVVHLHYRAAV